MSGRVRTDSGPFRTGFGRASCHHGEILQGVFRDARGRGCAGLVTLPVHGPGSRAVFVPAPGARPGEVTVRPAGREKARRAAALMVRECVRTPGVRACGGEVRIAGGLPVGLGLGSSSSDVVAALRAVADAFGVHPSPGTLARLAVRAERACDPLMLDGRPVLFAQREGRVLEVFGEVLPPVVVVGCALGGGAPVDTLSLPAPRTACTAELDTYGELRELLRRAVRTGDPVLLGRVATESARLGQRSFHRPEFAALQEAARRVGAVGVQIAHSGSVAGLLLDARGFGAVPAGPEPEDAGALGCGWPGQVRTAVRVLGDLGMPAARVFTTHRTPAPSPSPSVPSHIAFEESSHGHAHSGIDRPTGSGPARRGAALPAL
ncbi:GHMP kinase [Streptomyces sp. NBC_00237]|uniref:GHMP family kinase ATP-binding protein n=1 Tax=Streptomyces sp. NBC_00237 TaxID=2975687 RepID=UPI00225AB3C7|nr:GHMP kinase [Streptomyces sp. NBC_00237]MCX5201652.1 GHMP kinase [Streptomyces sp. NBC_00237]